MKLIKLPRKFLLLMFLQVAFIILGVVQSFRGTTFAIISGIAMVAGWATALAIENCYFRQKLDRQAQSMDLFTARMSRSVTSEIERQIGYDADLMDRVLTDLAFLHEQTFPHGCRGCPTCQKTSVDVEAAMKELQAARVEIRIQGPDDLPI